MHEKHLFVNLCFRVQLICPEKMTSLLSLRLQILSDFVQGFFRFCSLSSSFSMLYLFYASIEIVFLIQPVYLNETVCVMLGRESRV